MNFKAFSQSNKFKFVENNFIQTSLVTMSLKNLGKIKRFSENFIKLIQAKDIVNCVYLII